MPLLLMCAIGLRTQTISATPAVWYNSQGMGLSVDLPGVTQCDAHPSDVIELPEIQDVNPHVQQATIDRFANDT